MKAFFIPLVAIAITCFVAATIHAYDDYQNLSLDRFYVTKANLSKIVCASVELGWQSRNENDNLYVATNTAVQTFNATWK